MLGIYMTADVVGRLSTGILKVHGYLNGQIKPVSCLAVLKHPQSNIQLATGDDEGNIYLWDFSTGIQQTSIKASTTSGITALCCLDGDLMAAAGNTIYKYERDKRVAVVSTTFGGVDDEINWLATSRDRVIACSDDGHVVALDHNLERTVLARHESIAMAAACDPFDDFVISIGCDHDIKLVANGVLKSWDINTLVADSASMSVNPPFGNCIIVVPTSNPSFMIGLGDGSLVVLHRRRPKTTSERNKAKDFSNWKLLRWPNCHSNPVTAMDLRQIPGKQYEVVTVSLYGEFKFWRASDLLDGERRRKGLEAKCLHTATAAEFKAVNAVKVVDNKLYAAGIYKEASHDRKGGAVAIYEYPAN